eukprot:3465799-Pyramimonas_sp.AAC.2
MSDTCFETRYVCARGRESIPNALPCARQTDSPFPCAGVCQLSAQGLVPPNSQAGPLSPCDPLVTPLQVGLAGLAFYGPDGKELKPGS